MGCFDGWSSTTDRGPSLLFDRCVWPHVGVCFDGVGGLYPRSQFIVCGGCSHRFGQWFCVRAPRLVPDAMVSRSKRFSVGDGDCRVRVQFHCDVFPRLQIVKPLRRSTHVRGQSGGIDHDLRGWKIICRPCGSRGGHRQRRGQMGFLWFGGRGLFGGDRVHGHYRNVVDHWLFVRQHHDFGVVAI